MSFNLPPVASIAASRLRNACLACSRTLSPPTMFFCSSQAVCPETNTVFLPLATTTWENPCGKLGKRLFGLTYSLGISQYARAKPWQGLLTNTLDHSVTEPLAPLIGRFRRRLDQ